MNERRRGLGKGLGALIPPAPTNGAGDGTDRPRPVDVFFPGGSPSVDPRTESVDSRTESTVPQRDPARAGTVADSAGTVVDGVGTVADSVGIVVDTAPAFTPVAPPPSTTTPGDLVDVPGASFAEVAIADIRPNPRQPRSVFDEDELAELTASIREIGVLQPVVVRPVQDGYELVMGERRWRAAGAAGLEQVPAIIREVDDDDLLRDALLENLHRSQLNALEEAAAYQQLLDDFSCTQEELSTRIGRSRPQISNTLRLLKLPPLVQRRVAAGVLSAGHARALLGLADGGAMERLAQRIVAEGLSVRTVEEIVALGDVGNDQKPSHTRRPVAARPELVEIESRLSDFLDTRAKIAMGAKKGRVTIEFATLEDLGRILSAMGVDPADRLPDDA